MSLGVDLWRFDLNSYGRVNYVFDSNQVELDLMMTLDFFIDKGVLKIMTEHLDSLAREWGRSNISYGYEKAMKEMIYQQELDLTEDEVLFSNDSIRQWPKEVSHTMVLSDVDLYWNQPTESYKSKGKITIAAIDRTPIDLKVKTYLEVK